MSAEGIKPLASLDAAMLGRRASARRVPLSFAPIEAVVSDANAGVELPEVVRQVARLARALGIYAPAGRIDAQPLDVLPLDATSDGGDAVRRRVAFTLRLDAVRHGQLRRIASAEGRSAQQVLVDAFDLYRVGATGPARTSASAIPATLSSHSNAPTGNQP